MKNLSTLKNSKLTTSITLALLFALSPQVLAANPSWAKGYIGKVSFKINDDTNLQQRIRKVEATKTAYNQSKQQLNKQQKVVDQLQKSKQALTKEIKKLTDEISSKITLKSKTETDLKKNKLNITKVNKNLESTTTQLTKKQNELTKSKKTLASKENKLKKQEESCAASPSAACKSKVKELQQDIKVYKTIIAQQKKQATTIAAKVKSIKNNLNALKTKVSNQTKQIAKLNSEIIAKNKKVTSNKNQLKKSAQQIKTAKSKLNVIQKETKNLAAALEYAEIDKDTYKKRIIARVLDANKKGAHEGSLDGESDGRFLSNRLGTYHGSRDGENDGLIDGTRDGRERQRAIGYQQGQLDGSVRAEQEGTTTGTLEGTYAGNIDAAKKAATTDGTNRANASDAISVGTTQGAAAGMQRAVDTGKQVGTQAGEQEAVNKFESRALDQKTVSGSFAGAFARVIPTFPRNHQGRNYNPSGNYTIKVAELAFKDGYKTRYKGRVRSTYETVIPRIYNDTYTNNYEENYEETYSREYPNDRQAGYNQGEINAFNRDYGMHYDNAYNRSRTEFSLNPNTSSTEYQSTYRNVEESVYQSQYENLRISQYQQVEADTFNSNIEEQTELFRSKRHASVTSIYKSNPVLKFVSSSIVDGGINGVAANDGIFQPGETTIHNLVIQNFGDKEAKNVVVVMEDGSKSVIDSIPAKSITTVKGAAKSKVQATLGSTDIKILNVYSPLTAEASIQGRHFSNRSQGKVNSGDRKSQRVSYPLSLTGLSTNGTLIIGKNNTLSVNLINNSKRNYTGELKVEVKENAKSKIITKEFSPIASLNSSTTLKDSVVKVVNEEDVYTPITFTATVSKNGVTLGTLDNKLVTMAKSPYVEKAGKPVVVVNSEYSSRDLVDLLSTMGGLNGASVLDTSLASLNKNTLTKGVNGKTLLLLEKGTLKDVDGLLKKSTATSVVLLDELQNGLGSVKSISTFKDAEMFDFNVSGVTSNTKVMFANPMRSSGLKTAVPVMASDIKSYKKYLALAELMKLSNDQILKKIESSVTKSSFFSPTVANKQLMQAGIIRGIDETMRINKHYDLSGSGLSRDKDIANLLKDDKSLFHNKLGDLVDGKAKDKNISLFLFAHDFYYTMRNALKSYSPIEDRVKFAIQNRMFGALFISAALKDVDKSYKALKKYDKNLYKRVSNSKGMHAPFKMAPERD